ALEAAHQALVLQQLEAGVHRAGGGTPGALALVLDALHELVAVAGALGEHRQQRSADVAPPPPAVSPAHARAAEVLVEVARSAPSSFSHDGSPCGSLTVAIRSDRFVCGH